MIQHIINTLDTTKRKLEKQSKQADIANQNTRKLIDGLLIDMATLRNALVQDEFSAPNLVLKNYLLGALHKFAPISYRGLMYYFNPIQQPLVRRMLRQWNKLGLIQITGEDTRSSPTMIRFAKQQTEREVR